MVFLGALVNQNGCLFCCADNCANVATPTPLFDAQGRRVYELPSGQFALVVESVAGSSGASIGTSLQAGVDGRPDLQVQSTRASGNGSTVVCDTGSQGQPAGGIPGISPPNFSPGNQFVSDALNDFACRFQLFSSSQPCTSTDASGEAKTIHPDTTIQFCDFVTRSASFPPGDSLLTVQLRDVEGNLGPTAQIVVRVATPTPTPPS